MTGPPVAAASPFYPLEGQWRPSGGHAIPDRATHIALTVRLVLLGFTRHTTEFLSRPPLLYSEGQKGRRFAHISREWQSRSSDLSWVGSAPEPCVWLPSPTSSQLPLRKQQRQSYTPLSGRMVGSGFDGRDHRPQLLGGRDRDLSEVGQDG